jgi:hypothetical protein
MGDAITLGSLILPTDILLTLLNYLLFFIIGAMGGLFCFIVWHPYTRTSLLRMIGARLKILKWNWVIILLDYGGVIETISYNKSDKDFAEINGGVYFFYQAYVKYVLGVPMYIFLANDARNVTTFYEKVLDERGDFIYDVYHEGKLIQKATIASKDGVLIASDQEGNELKGAIIKHRLRPLAWSHYDKYHPELVSPKNLATGIKINRAENRVLAALAVQQSKLLIQLIFIGVILALCVSAAGAYTSYQQKATLDLILNETISIKTQIANLTVVYHA